MLYLDTSVLVAALAREPRTAEVRSWLGAQPVELLAISEWVNTEFSSALSLKVRTAQISELDRARILSAYTRLIAESFQTLPIGGTDFRVAASFADRYNLGLRAGDALHIAVALAHGATICTLDKRLASAASVLAVDAVLI